MSLLFLVSANHGLIRITKPEGTMNIGIDIFGFSESGRKLWNIESYPHGELYYDLAYHAIVDGDIDLAMKYFSKTIEALEEGHALSILNGRKPVDGDYDPTKRAKLKIVQ